MRLYYIRFPGILKTWLSKRFLRIEVTLANWSNAFLRVIEFLGSQAAQAWGAIYKTLYES